MGIGNKESGFNEASMAKLWTKLFEAQDIDDYLNEAGESTLSDLSDYITQLCRERGLRPADVLKASDIELSYGHRMFSGGRRPSRDKILQLAFGFGLDVDETQRLLTVGRVAALHPGVKRDAVIAYCLYSGMSITYAQIMLGERRLPLLGSLKKGD